MVIAFAITAKGSRLVIIFGKCCCGKLFTCVEANEFMQLVKVFIKNNSNIKQNILMFFIVL